MEFSMKTQDLSECATDNHLKNEKTLTQTKDKIS
jgi:hypothetical protein